MSEFKVNVHYIYFENDFYESSWGYFSVREKQESLRFKIATIFLLQMQQYVDHVQGLSPIQEKYYINSNPNNSISVELLK